MALLPDIGPTAAEVAIYLTVAVPVPGLSLLTYAARAGDVPPVGGRVVVPLGGRSVTGIVVAQVTEAPEGVAPAAVKFVRTVLDREPFLPPDVVDLARWTADYYAAGPGEAILAVLPPKTRGERADAHRLQRVAALTVAGLAMVGEHGGSEAPPSPGAGPGGSDAPPVPSCESRGGMVCEDSIPPAPRLSAKARAAINLLAQHRDGLSIRNLQAKGVTADLIARLAAKGLVSIRQERLERDPFIAASLVVPPADPGRRLTDEQQAAFEQLEGMAAARQFAVAVLHGVTGSGKTELYLRLAASVCAGGRGVLMLVPEIGLTPVMAALFRQAFGERVAIQHSGLSDGERHDQWQRIRRGEIAVVVGTRSAVFTPLANIGLVIVDEEHDTSYKQEESPRYHGRDVAVVRGQRSGALVVLGSATPSMETYQNAAAGRYARIVLERRVLDRPLAAVTIVDMREEYAIEGPDVVLSRALREGLQARLERGQQALVLLNRRGYATAVFCRQCGGTLECPNCDVSLVVHGEGRRRRAQCHYCNYAMPVPPQCPHCAGPYLEQAGFGTERVEAEVLKVCPSARVARLDRDAIRRKGALTARLQQFRDGEIDVLVGTQMIAKGHDFPRVTLVGVVSADVGLGMADFRASERTFQLLTQVAGRAGRGTERGEAIVQTVFPHHYSIQLACQQDYRGFFERELQFRHAMRYPPVTSLVNVVVKAKTYAAAMDDAEGIVGRIRKAGGNRGDLVVLGPAPAPLGRLRGEYRAQLLVKSGQRKRMRELVLAAVMARPELVRRTIIDIDPLSVL